MDKQTIDDVDCYGSIKVGATVEVVFTNIDSSALVESTVNNWADFIKWLKNVGYSPFCELVADND